MATLLRTVIDATGLSRRQAFTAIRDGKVSVRGKRRRDPSSTYSGGVVALEGGRLAVGAPAKIYLMLNKPLNYLTTTSDDRGRQTVMDLVPEDLIVPGLFPVGRLDLDTSGLLILTNDGETAHRLTHPKHEVEKEYWVALDQEVPDSVLADLRDGVEIEGAVRQPSSVQRIAANQPFEIALTITDGRKRQIRRMFEAFGVRVTALCRVREGALLLGSLQEGEVRTLTEAEIASLRGK